jgi:integrase
MEMLELRENLGYAHDRSPRMVTDFLDFCVEKYPDYDTITREMFESFLDIKIYNTGKTRNIAMSRIRGFMRYLQSNGDAVFVPGNDYSVKTEQFVPYTFTDEELQKLFDTIDSLQPISFSPNREYIIPVLFRMMYCCGMRPFEPPSILFEDVNLENGEIYIRQSKGYKDRRILMSGDLLQLCRDYASFMAPTKYFFERKPGERIKTDWATKQFAKCWKLTGLPIRTGKPRPYDLRHNFATRTITRWLAEGKDIHALAEYLSAYMGHSAFSITMYYIHLIPERLLNNPGVDWQKFSSIYPEVYRAKS